MVDLAKIMKMRSIIDENNYEFSEEQMNEIHLGMQADLDFFLYLNPKYSAVHMSYIRLCLENNIDTHKILNEKLSEEEVRDIYNDLFKEKNAIKHVHNYKKIILKQPNCSTTGIIKYKCKDCEHEYKEEIPKLEHNFTTTTVMPTCQSEGRLIHRCIVCGYTYDDEVIPKTDHVYSSEIAEEPTCKNPGKIIYTCINCKHKKVDEIPMIAHRYEEKIIPPSCIEGGYTLHSCFICGHSYRDNEKEKIPHIFKDWQIIKEPTCTEKGFKTHSCVRCNTIEKKSIAPLGHDYKITRKEPTCTVKGEIIKKCTRCNDAYIDDYIDLVPHTFKDWEIETDSTIYKPGIKVRFCSCCNLKEEGEIPQKKLTMETASQDRLNQLYNKKTKTKKREINIQDFSPILADYTSEEFEKYIKKKKFEFDTKQKLIIREGLKENLDVKIYANPNYSDELMAELKRGIEHGLDLRKYIKDYDCQQINEIRLGIEHGINIKEYLNKNYTSSQMREIRLALEAGLSTKQIAALSGCPDFLRQTPIGKMFQPKYSSRDMYEKREEMNKKNNN